MPPEAVLHVSAAFAAAQDCDSSALTRRLTQSLGSVPRTSADSDLVRLLADTRSQEALSELFRRHASSVFGIANRILRDQGEAEDIVQEVFTFAYQQAALFDPDRGTVGTWIAQVAYYRALDRRRHLSRRSHYQSQALDEEKVAVSGREKIVDEVTARALLSRMRQELSAEQVETLELHFFEGYTFHEIAEKTGRSFGAVRHHYYRGLERLRSFVFGERPAPR